ncbi:MAG: hypothetical protein IH594_15050, partial [Bacteroidales bacterium]|nr:hypothetical protein [Bacteroidales bacterium]
RYTLKNFTLLEQLEPFFDSTLERSQSLIPKPRKTSFYKSIPFIHSEGENKKIMPGVLLPVNPDHQIIDFVRQFNQKIPAADKKGSFTLSVLNKYDAQIVERQSLLFSIGNNQLSRQFADQLPFEEINDIPQAYFIHRLDQLENVIFIGYTDLEGLFHALQTLLQLIDSDSNTYHHYNIIDFPDYHSRGLVFNLESGKKLTGEMLQDINYLISCGFNTWIASLPEMELGVNSLSQVAKDWTNYSISRKSLPFLKKGVSLEELKIPGLENELKSPYSKNFTNKISSLTLELYDELKGLRGKNIDMVLFSDKTLWESIHSSENGIINLSHDDFNKFLLYRTSFAENYSRLDLNDFPLSYLVPYYQNIRISGDIYSELYSNALADSALNQWFSKILWNGPVHGATHIDPMDMFGFSAAPSLSFMDFSLSYRSESSYYGNYYSLFPGKALTGIIFKPFDTQIAGIQPESFHHEILVKTNDLSELAQIRLATAADFLWNTSHYNPVTSLWKVLNSKYGREAAKELVIFNDLYFKLLSVSLEMEMKGYNQRIEKQGEELVIQINLHWDKIKLNLDSQ